jgi:hypothetical protein
MSSKPGGGLLSLLGVKAHTQVVLIFGISVLCMVTCGTQYGLSAWSPNLKQQLNCTQAEIELVGSIGNVGPYLGPMTGQ